LNWAKQFKIPYFRGVFMRDSLPNKVSKIETGITNLDENKNQGTHWTAYYKKSNNLKFYFDSYGYIPPPLELESYLGCKGIIYNEINFQNTNENVCGHLCILWLKYITSKY
jgi:hypothetical protein